MVFPQRYVIPHGHETTWVPDGLVQQSTGGDPSPPCCGITCVLCSLDHVPIFDLYHLYLVRHEHLPELMIKEIKNPICLYFI